MKKLLCGLFLLSCGGPIEPVPPFIAIELVDPEGFVSQQADVFEVTNRAIVEGNPIEKVFEVPAPDHLLPTTFNIRFSEEVRGTNVDIEIRGLANGQEVFFASDTVVANVSVITMTTRFCGDEAIDAARGEDCDEGAANSDITPDACRSDCQIAGCGDGIVDSGEICDDGNNANGDGCRDDCTEEICGDGIQDPQEQCDDGDLVDNDGCDSDCVPTQITQITAGDQHNCVLFRSQQIKCWGQNLFGQLGYGNIENIGDNEFPSTIGVVDVGGDVLQVSAATDHTCAVLVDGNVRCWGNNPRSQLGIASNLRVGDDELPSSEAPVDVGGFVVRVATGGTQTCVLLDTGAVRCWGFGFLGYPGVSVVGDNETPAEMGDLDIGIGFVPTHISVSERRSCVTAEDGKVRCWGVATDGMLGLGFGTNNNIGDDEPPSFAPTILSLVRSVSAADFHSCALLVTGEVTCWGVGALGRLGYGNTNNIGDDEVASETNTVSIGGNIIDLSAGGDHTCVILSGGAVRCWGSGEFGVLGYGNINNIGDDELPQTAGNVNIGGNAVLISAGAKHTCVVLDAQRVRCWGESLVGQLGYGNQITIGDNELPSTAGDVPLF